MFNFDADFTDSLCEVADKNGFLVLSKIKIRVNLRFCDSKSVSSAFYFFSFNLERPDWFLKPVGSNILNEISISKEVYRRKPQSLL